MQQAITVRGVVSVAELCDWLAASPATIRRDLTAMEQEGLVRRSYGGVTVVKDSPAEQHFAVRQQQDLQAKRRMASVAVGLIEPGQTVFLSDGSTMLALAQAIIAAEIEVFVATQAINIAQMLAASERITVCLLGGFVRHTSFATCGPFAERMVRQINADWLFLSSNGFSVETGLSYEDPNDVALARIMLEQSQRSVAMLTAAKFKIRAPSTAVATNELNVMIAEQLTSAQSEQIAAAGIEAFAVAESFAR